ncbi:MAG: YeeE/YedE family protein [Chloroflexota bacterium]|nr:YeeE/YedE family protein [Chloroflexota bacterium]
MVYFLYLTPVRGTGSRQVRPSAASPQEGVTILELLPVPVPWYIVGPLMGLVIVGLYAVTNKHLGVSGAYVQFVDRARGRPIEVWRLWFLGGLVIGAALVAVLGTSPQVGLRYGKLGELLPLGALIAVLFVGGVLIGFGARWMGACTSGHGLSGCSTRSTGSIVATVTFFTTAVAVTLLLHVLTRGAL